LRKYGYDVDEYDAKDIFRVIDSNGDKKISIDELTNFINNNALKDQINDPGHFAFRIFEQIRKHLSIKQCSIAELFNVNMNNINANNHGSSGNYV
jgi:Ca2+-binding EF-hand superfamily protein